MESHDHAHGEPHHDHEGAHDQSPGLRVPEDWDESQPLSHYRWELHHPFGGVNGHIAVEVAPHSGFIRHWRFMIPSDYQGIVKWGVGAPGGGPVEDELKGKIGGGPTRLVNGPEVIWFGSADRLSSSQSAYLVFHDPPPQYISFGEAEGPEEPPAKLEGISFEGPSQ